jgi:hypothetical protein
MLRDISIVSSVRGNKKIPKSMTVTLIYMILILALITSISFLALSSKTRRKVEVASWDGSVNFKRARTLNKSAPEQLPTILPSPGAIAEAKAAVEAERAKARVQQLHASEANIRPE